MFDANVRGQGREGERERRRERERERDGERLVGVGGVRERSYR